MLLQPAPAWLQSGVISLWVLRGRPAGAYVGLPKPYVELIVSLSGDHLWRADASSSPLAYRDGWLTLDVPYSDTREILAEILKLGNNAIVLAPLELKNSHMDALKQTLANYHDCAVA